MKKPILTLAALLMVGAVVLLFRKNAGGVQPSADFSPSLSNGAMKASNHPDLAASDRGNGIRIDREEGRLIQEFKSELRALEELRIVDRSEATAELPISAVLREKLNIPSDRTTRTIDTRYLIVTPPSVEERESMRRKARQILSGRRLGANSTLEKNLDELITQFSGFPNQYKLLVLSRPRDSSGKNHLAAYNTDEVMELDEGGGSMLTPGEIENSFENQNSPYEPIERYGYLFSVRE